MTALEELGAQEREALVCSVREQCAGICSAALCALHPPLTCCSRTPCYHSPQGDPRCLNVVEFDRLLRESQKEVLRLQRQIALKNFKECLRSSKSGSGGSLPNAAVRPGPAPNARGKDSPAAKEVRRGEPAAGGAAHGKVRRAGRRPDGLAAPLLDSLPLEGALSERASRGSRRPGRFSMAEDGPRVPEPRAAAAPSTGASRTGRAAERLRA